ncbi:MAG: hypothetical protein WCK31_05215 [bacterium]
MELDKKFLLWCAYLIDEQHKEIYHAFSLFPKMSEEVKTELIGHHLCGYDSMEILIQVVKEYFPEMYEQHQSFNDMKVKVKKYLEKV